MIASLEFETNLHLLTFKLDKISYSVEIPHCITDLQLIIFDETGYMEFETNVGTESMDLLYNTEGILTVEQISQIQEYLKSNRKINVRCIR